MDTDRVIGTDETNDDWSGDDAQPVVTLEDVGHSFHKGDYLFRGLSMTLHGDCIYALVGPSGSGKSTLLSIIAGWQMPSEGSVQTRNVRKISWVFQNPIGVAGRSVLDHVALPYLAQGYPASQAESLAMGQLRRFGLEACASKRFADLSGGEAQRLMLARGVATNADVLLVDEPTAQLDLRTSDAVVHYLGALSESGTVVVIATHDHRTRDAAAEVIDLEHYQ